MAAKTPKDTAGDPTADLKGRWDRIKKWFGDSLGRSLTTVFTPVLTTAVGGIFNAEWYWIALAAVGGLGAAVGIMLLVEEGQRVSLAQRTRHLPIQRLLTELVDDDSECNSEEGIPIWLRTIQSALAPINTGVSEYFYKEFITRLDHDPKDEIRLRAKAFLKVYIPSIRDEDIGFEPVPPKPTPKPPRRIEARPMFPNG
jgi:hypothetical protein